MKLPKGITRTATGFRATVELDHQRARKRFRRDTEIADIVTWQQTTHARMRLHLIEVARGAPVGFRADALRYLETVKAMPTYKERKQHVELWVAVFGDRPRVSITPPEIRAQLQRWKDEGLSASACNHRRTALMHLYNVLDAHTLAANPVSKVPRFRPDDPPIRSLDYDQIRAILKAMRPSKSKARIAVLAWTGLPPATLKRIAPEHWRGETLYVPGRRKGKGTRSRVIGLASEAQKALKQLTREDAWGTFDTSALNRAFKRAAKKAKIEGATLYALRHSFITAVYLASGDIQATAELAGHAGDTRQTRRYVMAALSPRAADSLAAFGKTTAPKRGKKTAHQTAHKKKTA